MARLFGVAMPEGVAPRYNIAPSQGVLVARAAPDGAREAAVLRWGLIPSWAKDADIGNRMINARAESVAEKPAFRAAFRARRCLILADGFYEWKSEAGGKQPYRITLADGGPFALAGLWERWAGPPGGGAQGGEAHGGEAPRGETIESCTIVTTEANARLEEIHHRMPVILAPGAFDAWLDPDTPGAQAQALLKPYPSEALAYYRVSPRLNSPANDDPALIEPIDAPAGAGAQPRLL